MIGYLLLFVAVLVGCDQVEAQQPRADRVVSGDAAGVLAYVSDVKPTPAPTPKPSPGVLPTDAILPPKIVEAVAALLEEANNEPAPEKPAAAETKRQASACAGGACARPVFRVFRRRGG